MTDNRKDNALRNTETDCGKSKKQQRGRTSRNRITAPGEVLTNRY
jgi:hypothetical protein